jgi:hypothetical protein
MVNYTSPIVNGIVVQHGGTVSDGVDRRHRSGIIRVAVLGLGSNPMAEVARVRRRHAWHFTICSSSLPPPGEDGYDAEDSNNYPQRVVAGSPEQHQKIDNCHEEVSVASLAWQCRDPISPSGN